MPIVFISPAIYPLSFLLATMTLHLHQSALGQQHPRVAKRNLWFINDLDTWHSGISERHIQSLPGMDQLPVQKLPPKSSLVM